MSKLNLWWHRFSDGAKSCFVGLVLGTLGLILTAVGGLLALAAAGLFTLSPARRTS